MIQPVEHEQKSLLNAIRDVGILDGSSNWLSVLSFPRTAAELMDPGGPVSATIRSVRMEIRRAAITACLGMT